MRVGPDWPWLAEEAFSRSRVFLFARFLQEEYKNTVLLPPTVLLLPVLTKDRRMKKRNSTRKELATSVNEKLRNSQRSAAEIVDTVFATMKNTMVAGESIRLVQFGTLMIRDKSPRRGRNPKTGESMTITKRQMVTFRPSRRLRDQLNK
jgi:integration host factor subunit alpha